MEIAKWKEGLDNWNGMDKYRFYVPELAAAQAVMGEGKGAPILLSEDQGRHAGSVLRMAPGDDVILFDGKGLWMPGVIAGEKNSRLKDKVWVQVTGKGRLEVAPGTALTILTAAPKGDRAEWLVEQASQLNVSALHWLDCDRSVVKPKEGSQKLEKYRRQAVEAAKQCGRHYLMDIQMAEPLEKILSREPDSDTVLLWLEPRETPSSYPARTLLDTLKAPRIMALVGPEGGWSAREFALLEEAANRKIVSRVRLTETVLRIETACAAIAAMVMSER